MVISKEALLSLANTLPEKIDVEEVFYKIVLLAKVEQAFTESNQAFGQDWDEFKKSWLKEDLS